ncbi:MAG: hypothetical protein WC285_05960 [Candidatus Gracilibacteria bacterium]
MDDLIDFAKVFLSKLIMIKEIKNNLSEITENGLTVAEELEILKSEKNDKIYGPFNSAKTLVEDLTY